MMCWPEYRGQLYTVGERIELDVPVTKDEQSRWNAKADARNVGPGEEPAAIVRDALDDLPPGRALDVATGHGRNAIFLAERGWEVDAIDISRAMLDPAYERATDRSVSVNWILADIDDYCFPTDAYDVITVSYFDARDRLSAVKDALVPGGVLCYEHHLLTDDDTAAPSARYRFEPGELRTRCADLSIERYEENVADKIVRLIAQTESA